MCGGSFLGGGDLSFRERAFGNKVVIFNLEEIYVFYLREKGAYFSRIIDKDNDKYKGNEK